MSHTTAEYKRMHEEAERRKREEEERRKREEARLRRQCADLRKELTDAIKVSRSFGLKDVDRKDISSEEIQRMKLEQLQKLSAELSRSIKDETQRVERHKIRQRILTRLENRTGEIDLSFVVMDDSSSKSAGHSEDKAREKSNKTFVQDSGKPVSFSPDIDTLIEALSSLEDDGKREELLSELDTICEIDNASLGKQKLLDLKTRAHKALRAQEFHQLAMREMDQFESFEDPHSPQIQEIQVLADDVQTDKGLRDLRTKIEEVRKAEQKRQDALYVQSALKEVLTELGYDLGEGFEFTEFGEVAYANVEGEPGYALRVQVNPETNAIYTRLVSEHDEASEKDALVEAHTCASVRTAFDNLDKYGVTTQITHELQPGEVPVERRSTCEEAAFQTPSQTMQQKRRARKSAQRERTR